MDAIERWKRWKSGTFTTLEMIQEYHLTVVPADGRWMIGIILDPDDTIFSGVVNEILRCVFVHDDLNVAVAQCVDCIEHTDYSYDEQNKTWTWYDDSQWRDL